MLVNELDGVQWLDSLNPVNHDNRGAFTEIIPIKHAPEMFPDGVCQVSQSWSHNWTIRGLHFQVGMAKAFQVLRGMVMIVAVDIRRNSPNYGNHIRKLMKPTGFLYLPSGIAFGFKAVALPTTQVQYLHSTRYDPELAYTMQWDDPELNIDWELGSHTPVMSERDQHEGMLLEDWQYEFYSTLPAMQLTDRPLIS